MLVERVQNLTRQSFLENYLVPNRPVIVTDAMDAWRARIKWTPKYFSQRLGDLRVQVYDDLFDLKRVSTLAKYLNANFNRREDGKSVEYVRWYSRLKEFDFCWSDEAFARLRDDWSTPYFLPQDGYAIPRYGRHEKVSSEGSLFPYRGLFISGKGARTRLHRDPWTSSAVLCQFYGDKELIIYSPEQSVYLMSGREFVDVASPDLKKFPDFDKSFASYEDVLRPGEVLYIPSGWLHHVKCLTDSISVTWNFVHESGVERLCAHLLRDPDDPELEVLRFFLDELAHANLTAGKIAAVLTSSS